MASDVDLDELLAEHDVEPVDQNLEFVNAPVDLLELVADRLSELLEDVERVVGGYVWSRLLPH
jgi:hypothetical protein